MRFIYLFCVPALLMGVRGADFTTVEAKTTETTSSRNLPSNFFAEGTSTYPHLEEPTNSSGFAKCDPPPKGGHWRNGKCHHTATRVAVAKPTMALAQVPTATFVANQTSSDEVKEGMVFEAAMNRKKPKGREHSKEDDAREHASDQESKPSYDYLNYDSRCIVLCDVLPHRKDVSCHIRHVTAEMIHAAHEPKTWEYCKQPEDILDTKAWEAIAKDQKAHCVEMHPCYKKMRFAGIEDMHRPENRLDGDKTGGKKEARQLCLPGQKCPVNWWLPVPEIYSLYKANGTTTTSTTPPSRTTQFNTTITTLVASTTK